MLGILYAFYFILVGLQFKRSVPVSHSIYYDKSVFIVFYALFFMLCIICNKPKATRFFVVRAVGRIISGQSIGKIIILRFRVGTSKNKNIDHGVKETCAIKSTQEIDHISLL